MNLHNSWLECSNRREVERFQNSALIKLREQEKLFRRGTKTDAIALGVLELAREILLNLKYEKSNID